MVLDWITILASVTYIEGNTKWNYIVPLLWYLTHPRMLLQEEVVLEVLGLANQYGFVELQSAMSEYLKAVLHIRNVCLIFDIASMYGLHSLCETCCQFMDHNAAEVLQSEGFLSLSMVGLSHRLISCQFSAECFANMQIRYSVFGTHLM